MASRISETPEQGLAVYRSAGSINIYNVIHEKEQLCLSTWRLCNQLVHLLERWHVLSIVSETADDVMANVLT